MRHDILLEPPLSAQLLLSMIYMLCVQDQVEYAMTQLKFAMAGLAATGLAVAAFGAWYVLEVSQIRVTFHMSYTSVWPCRGCPWVVVF